jgi:DNA-directed RNA polymerase subunit H (RpoH/RPB5)
VATRQWLQVTEINASSSTKHIPNPKHTVCSTKEKGKLLKVYNVEDSQVHLPTILKMESDVRAY